jgi:hypothetical protein
MSETLKQALDILMAYRSEPDDNPMRGRNLHTDALLDRIAELEVQLAKALTRIAGLEAAAQDRFRGEWKADVGNPFFEAAKAAADERLAALKHEARGHLMRAEAAERTVAEMRAVLREIAQLAERASSNRMDGLTATGQFDAIAEQARAAHSRASDKSPQRG